MRQEYAGFYFGIAHPSARLESGRQDRFCRYGLDSVCLSRSEGFGESYPCTDSGSPRRFLLQLFKDVSKVDEPLKLMTEMHTVASSIQDVGLNFSSYPQDIEDGLNALFTDDEFRAIYEANNLRMNITNGSGTVATNEDIPARSAISFGRISRRRQIGLCVLSSHRLRFALVMILPFIVSCLFSSM